MIAADHVCKQLGLSAPKLCYITYVKVVAPQVIVDRMVAAACHRCDNERTLVTSEPHDAANAKCGVVRMRFNDQDPTPAVWKKWLHQLAEFTSQELANQCVSIFPAHLPNRFYFCRSMNQIPEFGLRARK